VVLEAFSDEGSIPSASISEESSASATAPTRAPFGFSNAKATSLCNDSAATI